jgi:hypothetical protein
MTYQRYELWLRDFAQALLDLDQKPATETVARSLYDYGANPEGAARRLKDIREQVDALMAQADTLLDEEGEA